MLYVLMDLLIHSILNRRYSLNKQNKNQDYNRTTKDDRIESNEFLDDNDLDDFSDDKDDFAAEMDAELDTNDENSLEDDTELFTHDLDDLNQESGLLEFEIDGNEEKEEEIADHMNDYNDDTTSENDMFEDSNEETNEVENDGNRKLSSRILHELFDWVKIIITAVILAMLLNKYILFTFTVPTESMENTIMVDNKIISLRCAYWFSEPERLDIVAFPFPDNPEETYIKRIIGLPGETIEGKDGLVYINGVALEEDYVTSDLDEDFGPYEIPEDSYFVLGDNRDISLDARYWNNKFLKGEDIISKAVLRFSPSFKLLK